MTDNMDRHSSLTGAPGPAKKPKGSVENYKLLGKLTKLEIALYVTSFLLILFGVVRSVNWFLIVPGILLAWAAELYGNQLRFGGSIIGFSDSLSFA